MARRVAVNEAAKKPQARPSRPRRGQASSGADRLKVIEEDLAEIKGLLRELIEDRDDVLLAQQARAESSERIPYDKVRRSLGLS